MAPSLTTGVATTSAAVPNTWSAGARVQITGVTTEGSIYNVAGTESGTISQIASVGTNSFTYYTNGTPSTTSTGTFTAKKYVASDTNAWTISSGTWSVSGVMGVIHDVPSCAELIQRIVGDANEIIRKRLAGMAA